MTRWAVVVALAARIAAWAIVPGARFESDEGSYYHAGITLLTTGEQDLFWPPFTGWLIAGAARLLHTMALPPLRLVWIAMDIGCLLMVAVLARRVAAAVAPGDARRARAILMVATFGYALYLPAISFAQFTTSEVPALLQVLGVLVLVTGPSLGHEGAALAGTLLGTLVLTRPSLMPLLGLVPAWVARRASWPGRVGRALVMLVVGATIVAALVARNWWVAGDATIARNGAYNLYIGNRDVYAEDLDLFSPRATPEQIAYRREFFGGTLQYPTGTSEDLRRAAVGWILDHPGTFARRALGRLARVFAPKTDVLELAGGERAAGIFSPLSIGLIAAANLQWACVLWGGAAGLLALRRHDRVLGTLFVTTLAGSVLLCLVAIAKPRYSFVFDPLLLLGTAVAVTSPRACLDRLTPAGRWTLAAMSAFFAWAWLAWTVFAVTSRVALSGAR